MFWIKLNELFENVSFDSGFTQAFTIQLFKVDFFEVAFFYMPIFQSIPMPNGLSKRISTFQNQKNAVFSSFSNAIGEKKIIQIVYWLISNSLSSARRWQHHRRM